MFMRLFAIAAFGLLVAACSTSPGPTTSSPSATDSVTSASPLWAGAVVANQTPAADNVAMGISADQYFFRLYECLKEKECTPYSGDAILTVREQNGDIVTGSNGPMEVVLPPTNTGWWKVSFPGSDLGKIKTGTLLCVQLDRPIAHQKMIPSFAAANQHIMCADNLYDYFVKEERGRSRRDAYGVAAIGSAG